RQVHKVLVIRTRKFKHILNSTIMNTSIIQSEIIYRTARSSGSGGQHVNKVETKVELLFEVDASNGLSEVEKYWLKKNLSNRINKDGMLRISVQEKRSQLKNKEIAQKRFLNLLKAGIKVPKKRRIKPIKPDKEQRMKAKRRQSEKKAWRKKVDF
ncbi:MAG: alternative ribosome rescue aminoacyl-tRNA hydrolase ArfB, partial [Bacteroidota bacterium]